MTLVPHLVQYQGSKRHLAPKILKYIPAKFNTFIEPFAGMAAMSIATASQHRAKHYYINDINEPLLNLLKAAIENPIGLYEDYKTIWNEQFTFQPDHFSHYNFIRDKFNLGNTCPSYMLYLLARCVKGAVRYNSDGIFNQGMDKRRHGTSPETIENNALLISNLLKGKVSYSAVDYREVLEKASSGDIVYMDPPYQGVSNTRDCRYYSGIDHEDFIVALDSLNKRNIDYLVSYDGKCGDTSYGKDLPKELNCIKILLNAGKSTQATFLGKTKTTYEALYVSHGLHELVEKNKELLLFGESNE